MAQPQFEQGEKRNRQTDADGMMHRTRMGKAEKIRRHDEPKAEDQIGPFFPARESEDGRNRQTDDRCTAQPQVDASGAACFRKKPGRYEENRREHEIVKIEDRFLPPPSHCDLPGDSGPVGWPDSARCNARTARRVPPDALLRSEER